ncbi:MAG: hypothetical protein ABEJ31_09895 [Haloarculaceae archaeon]
MVSEPVYWLYVLANLFVLVVGGVLTYLSFAAYRRSANGRLRFATGGFGVVAAGGLLELGYEFLGDRIREVDAETIVALHAVDSLLIGVGLSLLFLSLVGPDRRRLE